MTGPEGLANLVNARKKTTINAIPSAAYHLISIYIVTTVKHHQFVFLKFIPDKHCEYRLNRDAVMIEQLCLEILCSLLLGNIWMQHN